MLTVCVCVVHAGGMEEMRERGRLLEGVSVC